MSRDPCRGATAFGVEGKVRRWSRFSIQKALQRHSVYYLKLLQKEAMPCRTKSRHSVDTLVFPLSFVRLHGVFFSPLGAQ